MLMFRKSRRQSEPSCSSMEDSKNSGGVGNIGRCCYRSHRIQLEQEVRKLQKELQEEVDLHILLANATGHTALELLGTSINVPHKAEELLFSIASLEVTVSKLEEETVSLHFQLSQERKERRLFEQHLMQSPTCAYPSCHIYPSYSRDKQVCSLEPSNSHQLPQLLQPDILDHPHSPSRSLRSFDDVHDERPKAKPIDEVSESSAGSAGSQEEDNGVAPQLDYNLGSNFCINNLDCHPNKLSEEMVRCMRNIYLCLSESSTLASKCSPSDLIHRHSSPVGHLPYSPSTSHSGSSVMPSFSPSLNSELCNYFENKASEISSDSYGGSKIHQASLGSYTSAAQVSWMTVGKKQLEYAAEALKQFRFFVEKLGKVDPAQMTNNQRLAFWINLYNALMMHAYLAYGVPGSDMKLFTLMQKASYTVGGHAFNAAEIEYILLRMKPPEHRPQMALTLALHTFEVSEEHQKYSIEVPEPLTIFALSSGMYSSPAVRIFQSEDIHKELRNSLRDYVRASVGINEKGKLLVPKLLYGFAKGVVEDSLLVDWICRFLTPEQVSLVRDSTSQRKQRLLGARSFTIVSFDSRFRYLFLPDEESSANSS